MTVGKQTNVDQPQMQIAIGFGNVVKAHEIYVVPGTAEIGNVLKNPITSAIALLDVLVYTAEGVVDIAPAGATTAVAGLAAVEAVVNNTGIYGYKIQSGDGITLYTKGKFYLVHVDGVCAFKDQLVPSTNEAGAVMSRPGGNQTKSIGVVTKGNAGVDGGPIEAWVDFKSAQMDL